MVFYIYLSGFFLTLIPKLRSTHLNLQVDLASWNLGVGWPNETKPSRVSEYLNAILYSIFWFLHTPLKVWTELYFPKELS